MGYNGLPRQVRDTPERLDDRDVKLDLTVHAEINALAFAKEPLQLCTMYVWPLPPCIRCATSIIQHGIHRVVAPEPGLDSQWWKSVMGAKAILLEAGVEVEWVHDRNAV